MRLWLRHKTQSRSLHEWQGNDTSCHSVQCQGLNLEAYEVTGRPYDKERICQSCQTAIAARRGKF